MPTITIKNGKRTTRITKREGTLIENFRLLCADLKESQHGEAALDAEHYATVLAAQLGLVDGEVEDPEGILDDVK